MTNFVYYNANPTHTEEEDCVCRAISAGTGLNYDVVDNLLNLIADKHCCDKLNVECYKKVLEDIFNYKVIYPRRKTVAEIAKDFKNNIVIIRVEGHLTCSIYGAVADIWYCNDEIVDRCWIVQR